MDTRRQMDINDGKAYREELRLQNFQRLLHVRPDDKELCSAREGNDGRYLPISAIEMRLDEYYFGLWELADFNYAIDNQQLHGQLNLRVFHPIAKTWITRVGVAALPLVNNEEQGTTDSLTTNLPHLKTECLKNATKSLGKAFGRDLNRDAWAKYQPMLKQTKPAVDDKAFGHFCTVIGRVKGKEGIDRAMNTELIQLRKRGANDETMRACRQFGKRAIEKEPYA